MAKNSLLILFFILTACSSFPTKEIERSEISKFESLTVGDDAKKVHALLGKPSAVEKGLKDNSDELWVYRDRNDSQGGSITIDPKVGSVTGILIIPKEIDKEASLDFLLKNKFAAVKFEKLPLQRCKRHYFPREVFYINTEKGILIEGNSRTDEIASLSYVTSQYAKDLVKKIKECKK